MRRTRTVVLDGDPTAVRDAARRALGAGPPGRDGAPAVDRLEARVEPAPGGRTRLEIVAEASLHVPYFEGFFVPVVAGWLRRTLRWAEQAVRSELDGGPAPEPPRPVPFGPPVPFTQEQTTLLATLAAAALVVAFGSALFGQNVQFVARSFGADDPSLGASLAITRAGVVLALVSGWLADRRGRRDLLLWTIAGVCAGNALSAAAPGLAWFTAGQILVRGAANAAYAIAFVSAVEEAPEGARAYTVGMLSLAGGAGYGLGTALLPLADIGPQLWRVSFALSAASVVLLRGMAVRLGESRRWAELARRRARRGRVGEVLGRMYGRRFAALVVVVFALAASSAPTSQLANRYLGAERGFTGLAITVFGAVTSVVPFLAGLVAGSRLTETKGRRLVAAASLTGATAAQTVFFLTDGPSMWASSAVATFFGGLGAPALGALSTELFPTEVRGTASGMLLVAGVAGSTAGLVAAGRAAGPLGGVGVALAAVGAVALLAVPLLPALPEAAFKRLDEVSPPQV